MLRLIDGPNFSGRTTVLRNAITAARNGDGRSAAYVGPEVFTSFSGLASTVASELDLVGDGCVGQIVSALGIEPLLDRDLSTLSGGEEVLCAIAAGLACQPMRVALDCVFEQLDHGRRERALGALCGYCVGEVLLADNRSREWADGVAAPEPVPAHDGNSVRFDAIDGEAPVPARPEHLSDILISGLRHRYEHGRWVLDDLQLRLCPGTIVHLAGENGAGKSTLAKILVGALVPSAGKVQCNGAVDPWKAPGRLAAYHFQNPDTQLFRSTVREELLAGARVCGRSGDVVAELVDAAVIAFGLSSVLTIHPHELPFSMRKRVAMASTFACGTPWVILDEPTLGQDDHAAGQIATYVRRTAEAGIGIIIISHSQPFVDRLPHQRISLAHGKTDQQEQHAYGCRS
jgi:energy-coupling factor transport system ATP-binding protein